MFPACAMFSRGVQSALQLLVQIISVVSCTPEDYVATQHHERMPRPRVCPNCRRVGTLSALGYYKRYVSGLDGQDLTLLIRRFRCEACGRTVSLLPHFAQPYRFVHNDTIEVYFNGERGRRDVRRLCGLLKFYWQRFADWLPELNRAIAKSFGRAPPSLHPISWWRFLIASMRTFARATRRLVSEFRITIFGRYACHQPFCATTQSAVHRPS